MSLSNFVIPTDCTSVDQEHQHSKFLSKNCSVIYEFHNDINSFSCMVSNGKII